MVGRIENVEKGEWNEKRQGILGTLEVCSDNQAVDGDIVNRGMQGHTEVERVKAGLSLRRVFGAAWNV